MAQQSMATKLFGELRELKPGEKVNFTLTLTTCTPGCFTNKVTVTTAKDAVLAAEFTTRWKGRPALNVCVTETRKPNLHWRAYKLHDRRREPRF